jgi:hypothetical protein
MVQGLLDGLAFCTGRERCQMYGCGKYQYHALLDTDKKVSKER